MSETKDKILDTAERLIAEQGYAATSLRHIIAEAGVNLAAIHYHFGSKEELLDEVILRKAEPVKAARIEMLNRYEAEARPAPAPIERILEAFLFPMAEVAACNPLFIKLMGRMHAEGMMPAIIRRHFQPTVTRFHAAFRRSLPHLGDDELIWRVHFMTGALAHATCVRPIFPVSGYESEDFQTRMGRLVSFLSGAFSAPAFSKPEITEVAK